MEPSAIIRLRLGEQYSSLTSVTVVVEAVVILVRKLVPTKQSVCNRYRGNP